MIKDNIDIASISTEQLILIRLIKKINRQVSLELVYGNDQVSSRR